MSSDSRCYSEIMHENNVASCLVHSQLIKITIDQHCQIQVPFPISILCNPSVTSNRNDYFFLLETVTLLGLWDITYSWFSYFTDWLFLHSLLCLILLIFLTSKSWSIERAHSLDFFYDITDDLIRSHSFRCYLQSRNIKFINQPSRLLNFRFTFLTAYSVFVFRSSVRSVQ